MDRNDLIELSESAAHLNIVRYYMLVPIILLYYDWILTLPTEIEHFWKFKFTGPAVIFFLTRYVPLIGFVPTILAYYTNVFSSEVLVNVYIHGIDRGPIGRCIKHVIPFIIWNNILCQSSIAFSLLLRTYALHQKSRSILLLVSMAWVTTVSLGIFSAGGVVPFTASRLCLIHSPDNLKNRFSIAYTGLLAYEALVYFLTIRRTWSIRLARSIYSMSGDSLIDLIIRDGSLYFWTLLGVTSSSLGVIYLATPDLRTVNVTFNHIIPVIITSRLLLNLRENIQDEGMQCSPLHVAAAGWNFTGALASANVDLIGDPSGEEKTAFHSCWSVSGSSTDYEFHGRDTIFDMC
ncbi:hypothetical protein K439DRAFT_458413 [Ramaria rubella]|nr:hypothetical protein K439DRAFT_458413 [Ramaria rubella]